MSEGNLTTYLLLSAPLLLGLTYRYLYPITENEIVEPRDTGSLVKRKSRHLGSSSVQDLLDITTISQVLSQQRKIIILEANDTLDHCLMVLQENGITAVPIVDLQKQKYIGMVSVLDIAAFLASLFPDAHSCPGSLPNNPLCDVVNFSESTPFLPQPLSLKISSLLTLFSEGVHRVPVTDDAGKIVDLITETDILHFILANESEIVSVIKDKDKSIYELGMIQGIAKVLASSKVAHALPKVYKVGALAVVDSFGIFVGELSARHLRTLSVHNFMNVYKTIAEWKSTYKSVTALSTITLGETLQLLVESHNSRVWIIDDEGRPTGVVRSQDVLQQLVS